MIALIICSRVLRERVSDLVSRKPMEVSILISAIFSLADRGAGGQLRRGVKGARPLLSQCGFVQVMPIAFHSSLYGPLGLRAVCATQSVDRETLCSCRFAQRAAISFSKEALARSRRSTSNRLHGFGDLFTSSL